MTHWRTTGAVARGTAALGPVQEHRSGGTQTDEVEPWVVVSGAANEQPALIGTLSAEVAELRERNQWLSTRCEELESLCGAHGSDPVAERSSSEEAPVGSML